MAIDHTAAGRPDTTLETVRVEAFGATFDLDATSLDRSAADLRRQVGEYERGERETFDCSVTYPDDFTGRVMRAMREIPFGETRTYGDLAAALDTAPVAVGGACGRNPVPLVVPCHRVVASDGGLGGYSASGGLDTKRRLLVHEGVLEE
ncbi:methylated-DNA--[protein]-cysteine S-methyltransferase [Halomarina oriensis]|uniref:methylated-DNA--[protein]-cysteine S-methyltransferase n=1 Tax=Halomarina oriensis TaxID=671145 RepID=A0A6B0GPL8_9EURY|nr:MGMT family protein [Halomarina oriensis]MWG34603.1 methylated-DNA--[protein]-cysteine S-methyltransferase [Halomarina oriensis]